jgi:hypothetical protein
VPKRIRIVVGDRTRIIRSVTLDGVRITLDLTWLDRASGWYLEVLDADGVQRVARRRVEPGAELLPDRTWPLLPPGLLVASGTVDLTRREYLGSQVELMYLTADELAAA